MVVTCPHCHASYRLATTIRNAILVCHRCGQEFTLDGEPEADQPKAETVAAAPSLFDWKQPQEEQAEPGFDDAAAAEEDGDLPLFLLKEHHIVDGESAAADVQKEEHDSPPVTEPVPMEPAAAAPEAAPEPAPQAEAVEPAAMADTLDVDEPAAEQAPIMEELPETETELSSEMEIAPPSRKATRIWPWLVFILLLAGGAGLWFKQDLWLQNTWVRSTLINLNAPLPLQDSDWHIIPESVHSQWLTRDDNSRILVIEGEVENQLFGELPAPAIRVDLFDLPGAHKPVSSRILAITEPPSLQALKKAPYAMPPRDSLPLPGGGRRGFVLVVEKLPEGVRDFALTPKPAQ